MTFMEHRAWITINDFPAAEDEDAWTPFTEALERYAEGLGPVLSWEGLNVAQVVVSADVADRSRLAYLATRAVVDALHAAGLGELYPSAIDIEPVTDDEPVPA